MSFKTSLSKVLILAVSTGSVIFLFASFICNVTYNAEFQKTCTCLSLRRDFFGRPTTFLEIPVYASYISFNFLVLQNSPTCKKFQSLLLTSLYFALYFEITILAQRGKKIHIEQLKWHWYIVCAWWLIELLLIELPGYWVSLHLVWVKVKKHGIEGWITKWRSKRIVET